MERREFILSLPVALAASAGGGQTGTSGSESAPVVRRVEERLIMELWSLQDVCEEAILQTCNGCERTVGQRGCCMECEDLDALHWQIRCFRTIFESGIVCFPELRERYRLEREGRS